MRNLFFVLCLSLAACGGPPLGGVDTALYVEDTSTRADQQELYFNLMCARSGVARGGVSSSRCDYAGMGLAEWRRVVLAALNDIDDRCEIYLSSLYQAKLDRDAYLALLRSTASTTALILTATGLPASKTGSTAIAIVEAAFGLGEHSLDNYYSRLILEVDVGTLHDLVLKRQTAYRAVLRDEYMKYVVSRPTAYYAMRGYMRICLPASIEGAITASIHDITYQPVDTASAVRLKAASLARSVRGVDTHNDPDLERLRVFHP